MPEDRRIIGRVEEPRQLNKRCDDLFRWLGFEPSTQVYSATPMTEDLDGKSDWEEGLQAALAGMQATASLGEEDQLVTVLSFKRRDVPDSTWRVPVVIDTVRAIWVPDPVKNGPMSIHGPVRRNGWYMRGLICDPHRLPNVHAIGRLHSAHLIGGIGRSFFHWGGNFYRYDVAIQVVIDPAETPTDAPFTEGVGLPSGFPGL